MKSISSMGKLIIKGYCFLQMGLTLCPSVSFARNDVIFHQVTSISQSPSLVIVKGYATDASNIPYPANTQFWFTRSRVSSNVIPDPSNQYDNTQQVCLDAVLSSQQATSLGTQYVRATGPLIEADLGTTHYVEMTGLYYCGFPFISQLANSINGISAVKEITFTNLTSIVFDANADSGYGQLTVNGTVSDVTGTSSSNTTYIFKRRYVKPACFDRLKPTTAIATTSVNSSQLAAVATLIRKTTFLGTVKSKTTSPTGAVTLEIIQSGLDCFINN